MPITDEDERLHRVEDPSEHWSDSLYFNAWDPGSGLFLMTRIAILPNQRRGTAGMLAWLDGVPAYAYSRELEGEPTSDWDVMRIGGLTYRMQAACRSWVVQLDDGDDRAYLTWDGFTGCVDYADNREPLPRAVAWGHYEQTCAVHGDVVLGGRRIAVDGFGHRDHSWGFRDWAGVAEWHWVTGWFGTSRSFNLFHVRQADGTTTVSGFLHDQGRDHLVVDVERTTEEDVSRTPRSYRLTLVCDDGRRVEVTGSAAGQAVPVRPHDGPTIVHEAPMVLRSEGMEGFGVYELLENDTGR